MKMIISLIFFFVTFSTEYAHVNQNTGTLTVIVSGLENNKGTVHLGLYNSRENYEGKGKPFRGKIGKIENGKAVFTFDSLSYGEYAIKVYHDENSNGKIDKNFLGIPTESYGFSNNASGTFGPADYDDAKFKFNQNKMTMEIIVQ